MIRNLALVAFILFGGLAALLLNNGGPADPSLSRDPDTVDAYGGTVMLAGGAIDLPPPIPQAGSVPAATELGPRLRRMQLAAISGELGEPAITRELADGRACGWTDRATAADPDRDGRQVSVHLVAVADARGTVRQVLAVASGGRVVHRW